MRGGSGMSDQQPNLPDGSVTAIPHAGQTQIPLKPEPIHSRKKGEKSEVIPIYDAEFRAGATPRLHPGADSASRLLSEHRSGRVCRSRWPNTAIDPGAGVRGPRSGAHPVPGSLLRPPPARGRGDSGTLAGLNQATTATQVIDRLEEVLL